MQARTLLACAVLAASACAPHGRGSDGETVLRTGDPYARGYTDADFPRVQRIADGVYTYEQLRSAGDEKFTTVSMFVVTAAGVLVADGQGSVAETQRLVDTIAGITSAPITHVVVCSDHGDHTAGNAAFPESATFLVQPTSFNLLSTGGRVLNRPAENTRHELVDDRKVIQLGGKEIHVLFLGRAHTGGDLVVHLPNEKVLFMSEAYLNRIFPALRSAYPSEWVAMIDRARALNANIYVPGHGFVDSPAVLREELDTYQRALRQVIAEATRLHAAGRTVAQAVAEARFGDLEGWTLRSSQGPIAIRRVYMELNGELR
ncbi:MAG TPA: MBL fold metallo-hydrolase [Longimicrobiales bacterium]|nr:MBL fold metallo-hydrolase [Longimicrobiales bacterium]